MNDKTPLPTLEQQEKAKLIAMIVRNAMEDFHANHLSDAQMKELNPIIRNAICTGLHMIDNQADPRAAAYRAFQTMMIPEYWEDPQLLGDYLWILNKPLS